MRRSCFPPRRGACSTLIDGRNDRRRSPWCLRSVTHGDEAATEHGGRPVFPHSHSRLRTSACTRPEVVAGQPTCVSVAVYVCLAGWAAHYMRQPGRQERSVNTSSLPQARGPHRQKHAGHRSSCAVIGQSHDRSVPRRTYAHVQRIVAPGWGAHNSLHDRSSESEAKTSYSPPTWHPVCEQRGLLHPRVIGVCVLLHYPCTHTRITRIWGEPGHKRTQMA